MIDTCTYTSSCNFSKHLYKSNLYREDFYSKKQMSQWSKYTCRAPNVVGHFLICDLSQKTLVIDTTKVHGLLGGKYNNNSSRSWINRFYNTMYLHDIFCDRDTVITKYKVPFFSWLFWGRQPHILCWLLPCKKQKVYQNSLEIAMKSCTCYSDILKLPTHPF